jgi:hypothetical protein
MLPIKLFWLVFCLFGFNQNIKTLCFGIDAKQPKQTSAETSFSSSFGCFESKLVSKYTLPIHIASLEMEWRGRRNSSGGGT